MPRPSLPWTARLIHQDMATLQRLYRRVDTSGDLTDDERQYVCQRLSECIVKMLAITERFAEKRAV